VLQTNNKIRIDVNKQEAIRTDFIFRRFI